MAKTSTKTSDSTPAAAETKTDEYAPHGSDSYHGELVNEDEKHHGENGLPPVAQPGDDENAAPKPATT